jgi:molybdenum cofactor cytidylyltransferase
MLPAVIVLAAGLSRRFGDGDKLMAQVQDRPVIAHVLDTVRAAEVSQRVLVTRAESAVVELADGFEVVVNPDPEAGMGLSIALGVQALRPEVTGVFVVLGDMPFVEASAYAALAATDGDIVVPAYDGRQGHPVLFRRVCFEELSRLSGQAGARRLIDSGQYEVVTVALEGRGGLVDLDTPDDVSRTRTEV